MIKLNKNEERIILVVIAILLCIMGIYRVVVFKSQSVKVIKSDDSKKAEELLPEKIYVYITGEVKKPGLYIMKQGDRVTDVVEMAGGFTESAEITSVNMAQKLKDEEFINIAKKPDNAAGTNTAVRNPIVGGKININIATAKELDEFLPNIGETYANRIVSYRDKNGRFKSVEELTRVEGIGSGKRFQGIKDLVTVN